MYWKINFNKIKQGFIGITSDLDIAKACEVMNSWNDNEQLGDYNEPCAMVTNERAGKGASEIQWPMRGQENVTGWGWTSKNF